MIRIRTSNQPFVPLALLALCAIAVLPASLRSQTQRRAPFAVGTESLRWLMKNANLEAVPDRALILRDPQHSILIVLGDLNWLDSDATGEIATFVERGGALLAASDRESGQALLNLAGVKIKGLTIEQQGDRNACHRHQPDRPFVAPDRPTFPDGSANPFSGLKVATNIPSSLVPQPKLLDGIVSLASFPKGVVEVSGQTGGSLKKMPAGLPFAVGGQYGAGRVLILADHSLFINEMLVDKECDNFPLTQHCLEWLEEWHDGD